MLAVGSPASDNVVRIGVTRFDTGTDAAGCSALTCKLRCDHFKGRNK